MHFNDEDVTQQAHQGPDSDLQEVPIMGGDLPQFGDYVEIEQKRFKGDNEFYTYKVIGTLRSNMWVDVPVVAGGVEDPRDEMADVVSCICCGVAEYTVQRFRVSDVRFASQREPKFGEWINVRDKLPEEGKHVLIANSEGIEIAHFDLGEDDGPDNMGFDAGWVGMFALPGRSFGNPDYMRPAQFQPTHWMPLPEHPCMIDELAFLDDVS